MKAHQVLNSQQIMMKMADATDLPLSLSVKLLKRIRDFEDISKITLEKQAALFSKYGEEDPVKEQIIIKPENQEAFQAEYQDMVNTDIDWDHDPLDPELFGDKISLSIRELTSLEGWFIVV